MEHWYLVSATRGTSQSASFMRTKQLYLFSIMISIYCIMRNTNTPRDKDHFGHENKQENTIKMDMTGIGGRGLHSLFS